MREFAHLGRENLCELYRYFNDDLDNHLMSKRHAPTLDLDLDGTITEAPKFFSAWTKSWPGRVVIITYRNDREKTIADLKHHEIRYDDLVLVERMDAKAAVIAEHGVTMYVDDQPEMLKNVPDNVGVMLFRNEGNFDFDDERWMLSDVTGKLV